MELAGAARSEQMEGDREFKWRRVRAGVYEKDNDRELMKGEEHNLILEENGALYELQRGLGEVVSEEHGGELDQREVGLRGALVDEVEYS